MINLGIIGCGYWGVNYVRIFSELAQCQVKIVCDAKLDRLAVVKERYREISTTQDAQELLSDKNLDAIVIATPATMHFQLAKKALENGKHVLAEKPLTTDSSESAELIKVARENNRILMVGHTFLYNPGILKVKEIVKSPSFGKMYYLHATRTNLGPIRPDINAFWDLAAHDVSIFNFLLDSVPVEVSAVGSKVLGTPREDIGFATLKYPGNVIANIHVSWADPNKVRTVVAVGSQQRVLFDDLNNMERVRIFQKGVELEEAETFGEFRFVLRDGDIISPRVEVAEPLKRLGTHFLECVEEGKQPLTDGQNGLEVVEVMAAIDESLKIGGGPVKVEAKAGKIST
jgi:predicted dehydrogenase